MWMSLKELIFDMIRQEDIYNIFSGESICIFRAGFSVENKNAKGEPLQRG